MPQENKEYDYFVNVYRGDFGHIYGACTCYEDLKHSIEVREIFDQKLLYSFKIKLKKVMPPTAT